MRGDPRTPEWTGERSYDQGKAWNVGESKKIMKVGSGELVKKTNPGRKGISFSPYSRETTEKRQVQSGNQVSCATHLDGMVFPRAWRRLQVELSNKHDEGPICLDLTWTWTSWNLSLDQPWLFSFLQLGNHTRFGELTPCSWRRKHCMCWGQRAIPRI